MDLKDPVEVTLIRIRAGPETVLAGGKIEAVQAPIPGVPATAIDSLAS